MISLKVNEVVSAVLNMVLAPLVSEHPAYKPSYDFNQVIFPSVAAYQAAMNYLTWAEMPRLSQLFVAANVNVLN